MTDVPALSAFPFQSYDKVRYADTDRQGHINNANFSTFLETGRVEFLYDGEKGLALENASFVIAGLQLSFVSEAHWPGQIDIGTAVKKIGNSSVTLSQALFQNERCVATAETVIVQMDETTRRSKPFSDHARAFFENAMLNSDA